jgi:Holliday junction resolvase-like predicted endonuclease
MTSPSHGDAALLAETGQKLAADGLRILDRRWTSQDGDHALDLVASASGRTLVVPLITLLDPGDDPRETEDAPEDRTLEALAAADAWITEHGTPYEQVRLDHVTFLPAADGTHVYGYSEDVD